MKIKTKASIIITIGLIIIVTSRFISAIDAPHNASNMYCGSCHGYEIFWVGTGSYDTLCQQCHKESSCSSEGYPDTNAPSAKTHTDSNGNALAECRTCHDPHYQRQKNYKNTDPSNYYLAKGQFTACSPGSDTSTLTYSSPITYKAETGWDATRLPAKTDICRRTILFPNVNKLGYSYPIIAVAATTITVKGSACEFLSLPSNFAVIYGQYIKDYILTDEVNSTYSAVKFFDQTGQGSFAYNENMTGVDPTRNGVCQVCHNNTTHWKADGTGTDHYNNNNYEGGCIFCHRHTDGFAHGGGGSGTGCGTATICHGTLQSHPTHVSGTIGTILPSDCSGCHDTSNFPYFIFKPENDSNGDGKIDLSETDVCDNCHSSGGTFNGVGNYDPKDPNCEQENPNSVAYGAKCNWKDGIYQPDGTLTVLKVGKEKWCATCHDDAPPTIPPTNGITAKNVAGNNIAYGYFVSGHGKYDVSCTKCHDPTLIHLDAYANTYLASEPEDGPRGYKQGYRLKDINGQSPMDIPRTANYDASQFALCYSCHNEARIKTSNFNNFVELITETNYHGEGGLSSHTLVTTEWWDSDRQGGQDSGFSCTTCHNPHGKDYDGRATFSMTRQDMGIFHKREVMHTSGYMEIGAWYASGGDLHCFGCHPGVEYVPGNAYYYQLGTPSPQAPGFRTKLNSENDITNPTYGNGGTFLGGSFADYTFYGETKTGLNVVNSGEGCEFPTSNLNKYNDTIEFWYVPNFNFSGHTGENYLFYSYNDPDSWIRIEVVDNKLRFQIRSSYKTSPPATHTIATGALSWTAGSPHHIVCTFGPAQGMHMYLDKLDPPSYSLFDGFDYLGGIDRVPQYFYIGKEYSGGYPANGIIDDFKIYGYQYQKFESDLAFFSKMDSLQKIQNPETGTGGSVSGSVSYLGEAQQGYSVYFNSTQTGAVLFPTSNLNNEGDTIDFWYYPDFKLSENIETNQRMFYCGNDTNNAAIGMYKNQLGFRIVEDLDGDGTPTNHTLLTTPLSEGVRSRGPWFHIVCTWGPGGMHIYIDDREANYSISDGLGYTGPLFPTGMTAGNFLIGNKSAGTSDTCDGYIDELRIYGYQASPQYVDFITY